mmetsp:Transcript_76100/g.219808  ORF Transcript_76100/g.219808 Transcript_76100/m.219808 type:complete len:218 (-) Transcript_76100:295-948(-)
MRTGTFAPACASTMSLLVRGSTRTRRAILTVVSLNWLSTEYMSCASGDAVSSKVLYTMTSERRKIFSSSTNCPSRITLRQICQGIPGGRSRSRLDSGTNKSKSMTGLWKMWCTPNLRGMRLAAYITNSQAVPSAIKCARSMYNSLRHSMRMSPPSLRHDSTFTSLMLLIQLPPKPGKSRATTLKPRWNNGRASFIQAQALAVWRSVVWSSTAVLPGR